MSNISQAIEAAEIQTNWNDFCQHYQIDRKLGVLIDLPKYQGSSKIKSLRHYFLKFFETTQIQQILDCLKHFTQFIIKQEDHPLTISIMQDILIQILDRLKQLTKCRTEQTILYSEKLVKIVKKAQAILENEIGLLNFCRIIKTKQQIQVDFNYLNLQLTAVEKCSDLDKKIFFKSEAIESFYFQKLINQIFFANQICENNPWLQNILIQKIQIINQIWSKLLEQKQKILCVNKDSMIQIYNQISENTHFLDMKIFSFKCFYFPFCPSFYVFTKLAGFWNIFTPCQLMIIDEITKTFPKIYRQLIQETKNGQIREYCTQSAELRQVYNKMAEKFQFYIRIKNERFQSYIKPFLAEPQGQQMVKSSQEQIKSLYL